MKEGVRQRIIEVLRINNATVNSLAKGNSSLQRKLQRQINEGAAITTETINLVIKTFPSISVDWLMTGEGEMLKNEMLPEEIVQEVEVPYSSSVKLNGAPVPYLEGVTAECGLPSDFTYLAFEKECEKVVIPDVKADFILKAHGNSMDNKENPKASITNGSLVACRRVYSGVIQWGSVYALATVDGIIIKQIKKHSDPEKIMCYSYNADYEPFEFPKEFILDTARVVKVLNYCDF